MLVDTVKIKAPKKIEGSTTKKPLTPKKKKSSNNTPIIIVTTIILLLAAYVAGDILFFKAGSQSKAVIVNEKFDSLKIYLDKHLIKIDEASATQEKQLEELKNLKK